MATRSSLCLVALVVAAGACGGSARPARAPLEGLSGEPSIVRARLVSLPWRLVEVDGKKVSSRNTLIFSASSRNAGGYLWSDGCNGIFGRYSLSGNTLTPTVLGSHLIDCPPSSGGLLTDFILSTPYRVHVGEGELVLTSARASTRQRWARYAYEFWKRPAGSPLVGAWTGSFQGAGGRQSVSALSARGFGAAAEMHLVRYAGVLAAAHKYRVVASKGGSPCSLRCARLGPLTPCSAAVRERFTTSGLRAAWGTVRWGSSKGGATP